MCRIAGIIQPSSSITEIETTVLEMCELQKHGGPDDGGIFSSAGDHLTLGNRRLSLLDLSSGGHQPMHYGHRYTITYNGELYNFKELKAELQAAGMQFVNNTDTEVILSAFAAWHTESFSRLNGMFAFALWDKIDKMLYLVRDKAGIKPLYWSSHSGGIAFASEIRAFAPIPYLQKRNDNIPVFQLAYGYIPEPLTTLEHVRSLPKGCFIQYDVTASTISLQAYSFFSFKHTISNLAEAGKFTQTVTEEAVKTQMIADAPVGVFLSGGVDSAIIANLAAKGKHNLHTLSIWFGEEKYSEKKYQDVVAKQINSRHHSFLLKEADFHEHFPEILKAMDMPSCDGINTWFISKFAAAEGLKAVLSGIGADELFGGYPSFRRMKAARLLQQMPDVSFRLANNAGLKKWNRISYLKMEGIRGLYLFLRGHFTPIQIAEQTGAYEKEVWTILNDVPASPILAGTGAKNAACFMEFNLYMQDQLLRDADVMSMAHGLEIRVPFLDNNLVDTVFSMSEKIKFGGFPKELLVSAFKGLLPQEIRNRPKMGFSFPFAEWLRHSEYVNDLAESSNIYTRRACRDFLAGRLHWSRIMSLIVLKHKIPAAPLL